MSRTHSQQLADRHEQDIAKQVPNGYLTRGSGSKIDKSDVGTTQDGSYFNPMIECKATQKKSYSVSLTFLKQLKERAVNRGVDKKPWLAIRFYDEFDRVDEDWVLMRKDDALEMYDWKPSAS